MLTVISKGLGKWEQSTGSTYSCSLAHSTASGHQAPEYWINSYEWLGSKREEVGADDFIWDQGH